MVVITVALEPTGQIRPVETRALDVDGTHDEIVAALRAPTVNGWTINSITSRPVVLDGHKPTVVAADIGAM